MKTKGLMEFKEKLLSDKEFAKKFNNIEAVDEVVALAAKEGFNFTAKEMKENDELTDAELQFVAGGANLLYEGPEIVKKLRKWLGL